MKQFLAAIIGTALLVTEAPAQERPDPLPTVSGLRARIRELFVFGPGGQPLGVRDSTGAGLGGFVASSVGSNANLIDFLESAIASNLGNIPFSSANTGFTLQFRDGAPVLSREAPGPIFAERAETLGAGRVLVGSSINAFRFTSIRGVPLNALRFNFSHRNQEGAQCDAVTGADCSVYGVPSFENEVMQFDLDFDLRVRTLSFVFAYGLLERLDVGVAVPIVFTSFRGTSRAQIIPFGGPPVRNFFEGTADDPQLISDPKFVEGSASGIGDLTVRAKLSIRESGAARLALLLETRFATGSENDLLGAGAMAVRALAVASTTFDAFSPHLNIGYLYRADTVQTDAIWLTTGFDQVLAPWATLAVDLVSQLQVGDSRLTVPKAVVLQAPYTRIIEPSIVPDRRDDIIDASVGFKFTTTAGITLIANTLWPLNRGGVRSNVVLTTGLEYTF